MKASYGVDVSKLKKTANVWSQDAMLRDVRIATMTKNETETVNEYLSQIGKLFNGISGTTLRTLEANQTLAQHIEQFNNTLDKNLATKLFKLLMKYRPEDDAQKKERLVATAAANEAGKEVESKKPVVVKFGINHITYLVEQGKAQLVCIAHDVDPIELVIWLPALCRQMNVPYCIVKGKARLGTVVHKKTATALALTGIKNEDKMEFSQLVEAIKGSYNDKFDKTMRTWGGGIMGVKSQAKTKKKQRIIDAELRAREKV